MAGPDRAEDFDREINQLQSTLYLAQALMNIIPGMLNDFMKKKMRKDGNDHFGLGIALIGVLISTSIDYSNFQE